MNKRFVFGKVNLFLFVFGIMLVIIGYLIMTTGDITISPILLAVAYVIIFPAAILWGFTKRTKKSENDIAQGEDRQRK